MGEIKLLHPAKTSENQEIVDTLRMLLRDAKAGRIQTIGVAVSCVDPDGDGGRATETTLIATDGWQHSQVAAISGLWFRLMHKRSSESILVDAVALDDTDE